MITAGIQFLQNSLTADLSQLPIRLKDDLQHMGVLTPPNLILLDNARTLKIELYPEDNRGERIIDLVNKKSDTLGAVNHLCYSIRCMDARDKTRFLITLIMVRIIRLRKHNRTRINCANSVKSKTDKTRNADSEVGNGR